MVCLWSNLDHWDLRCFLGLPPEENLLSCWLRSCSWWEPLAAVLGSWGKPASWRSSSSLHSNDQSAVLTCCVSFAFWVSVFQIWDIKFLGGKKYGKLDISITIFILVSVFCVWFIFTYTQIAIKFSSLFRLKSLFLYFLPSFFILHATKIAIIYLVELHISGSRG